VSGNIGLIVLAVVGVLGCCFLGCFFLALCRETKKHRTTVRLLKPEVMARYSKPRHLAPVIELKRVEGRDGDDKVIRLGAASIR